LADTDYEKFKRLADTDYEKFKRLADTDYEKFKRGFPLAPICKGFQI